MDELEQFKQTFFEECEGLLSDLEEHMLRLQDDGEDTEALHAAFRAVHSVKGGAGAFGFDRLVSFAHKFETTLDLMREGDLDTSESNVALAIRGADVLTDLVNEAQNGVEVAADREEKIAAEFTALIGNEDDAEAEDDFDFIPVAAGGPPDDAVSEGEAGVEDSAVETFLVDFEPHHELFQRANEPLLLIRELKSLGTARVDANLDNLPSFADMDPESAYIAWRFTCYTKEGRAAIEEVFEFVEGDCTLAVMTPDEAEATPKDATEPQTSGQSASSPKEPMALEGKEILVADPRSEPAEKSEEAAEKDSAPIIAAEKSAPAPPAKPASKSIRVDLEKLDSMVNMVGELVITQAMLTQYSNLLPKERFPELLSGIEELSQHTRELQDNVMALRAQPIKTVFSKIPRLVRELSVQTGKRCNLIMSGETTEIDKTVIEQLSDPLTHMIRNSVDHGIETPEERMEAGKSPEGTIHLSAEQRGGRIVIEIQDDGRGIHRDKVLEKAIAKGLVSPKATLSDEEVDNLIFLPGFSTAESVSNISGRGVGMDVVIRNIKNMNGRVNVRSVPGMGSNFSMSLPLTLAVLDGMIVVAGGETYVLPLAVMVESIRPAPEDVRSMAGHSENVVLSIRGEFIPLLFLHKAFNLDGAIQDPSKALVVVVEVEGEGKGKMGIVVDEIVGQQQVVVKNLEDNFGTISGVAGATILGSGKVALILDAIGLEAHLVKDNPPGSPPQSAGNEPPKIEQKSA